MKVLDKQFWSDRYKNRQTGWDIGYPATPLKEYIDQLTDKNLKILIPGCGNAYEASYLFSKGFKNVYLLDIAEAPIEAFSQKEPEFPSHQLIVKDFFEFQDTFDLILEQTFFCALHPSKRTDYVQHIHNLLKTNGKVAGLLFSKVFDSEGPPYGGNKEEYIQWFSSHFIIKTLEECYNSIPPRLGNELFFIFEKK